METPDLELEAQWQEAALVGSPQLRSPRKTPQNPRQNPPVSSQEQALSFKRRKGAFGLYRAHVFFHQILCCAGTVACSIKACMSLIGERCAGVDARTPWTSSAGSAGRQIIELSLPLFNRSIGCCCCPASPLNVRLYPIPEVQASVEDMQNASATPLNAVCAVDEDLVQGQDHVYVVFTLPALGSPAHRSRTIQPGPWGPDVKANGLMSLVGHSYVQKGDVQCLSHHKVE